MACSAERPSACSSWWRGPPAKVLEMDPVCCTVSHDRYLALQVVP